MDNTKSVVVSTIINNADDSFIRALLDRIPVDIIFDAIVEMSQQKDEQPQQPDLVPLYDENVHTLKRLVSIFIREVNDMEYLNSLYQVIENLVNSPRYYNGFSNKVVAVKHLRNEFNIGLKTAVDFINECCLKFGWEFK